MRAFIAIPSPEGVKREIMLLQDSLSETGRFTMVPPGNLHLTTNFLGEINTEQVSSIIRELESLEGGSFDVSLKGLSTFPGRGRPRIVWIGVLDGAREVVSLQARVKTLIDPILKLREDKEFRPHITIARVKEVYKPAEFRGILDKYGEHLFCRYSVDHIDLMESELTPSGPIYSQVRRFELKG